MGREERNKREVGGRWKNIESQNCAKTEGTSSLLGGRSEMDISTELVSTPR